MTNNLTEARYNAMRAAARIDDLIEQVNGSSRMMLEALQFVENNGGHDDAEHMQAAFTDALFAVRVALRTLEGYAQSSDDVMAQKQEQAA